MISKLRFSLSVFACCAFMLFSAARAHATHIFGVDLYYSHVAGNTYTIHLIMYGDCSGAAFGTFPTSVPVVNIYNGNTFISSVSLALQAPAAGLEVTPVCPADAGLTTCTSTSFTIPGVKKFVYTANVTVSGPSAVWRFLFQGVMGSSSAGRSGSITNITSPGSTLIQLVDTLNNTTFANSSAVYTTIPTPFFCDNVAANFNPGAVDPDGDSLAFYLAPGVDATTGTNVSYIFPYTATAPLATSPGTFSFSATTGQLSFTPNVLQRSLVVYNVEEYHAGAFRGTSQREMTVVVLTCTSTPPSGDMSGASAGTLTSPTTLDICDNAGAYTFHINPTDAGGNHITMTAAGLPAGSTFNIVGNGTLAPLGTFSWTTTGVAPGSYIFYITFKDDGCPLSGIQTIAYTINVLPMPSETFALVSPATCIRKAVFTVTPGGSASPWTIKVIQAGATVQTLTGITGMITDSLVPGAYTIRIINPGNCYVDTTVTLVAPPLPVPSVTAAPPLCPGGATGSATITASGGTLPYLFAIGTGAYSSSGSFTGLTPGSYTLHVKDANSCVKDTLITIPNATPILMNIAIRKPICDTYSNGSVIISAYNSVGPYTYALGGGAYSANDTFSHLGAGNYTFHVKNANGCIADTILTLVDSVSIHGTLSIAPILCNMGAGTVTVTATGGSALPFTYAYNTNPFGASDVFTLPAGTYSFHVHDPNACYWDTSITLTQPLPVTITPAVTNILCHGAATGMAVIAATGGTPAYVYNIDGGAYGPSNTFSGLTAGVHTGNVQDANGCIYSAAFTVTQPAAVAIDSVAMVKPLCNGGSNGSITIHASGGTAPYTYAAGTGTYGTGSTITALAAGAYVLHVKDANGCIKDTTVNLLQPAGIIPSATVTPSLCHTLGNGRVTLSASGGTPAYTFAVGSGAYGASATFTPLAAGAYTFHIKDAHGCIKDTLITINDSMHVYCSVSVTSPLCYNQANGYAGATGAGGTSPYLYGIGTGAYGTGHFFTGLAAGSYTIHVVDVNGCKDDTLVSVTQPGNIVPSITITTPTCFGLSNGAVTATATGGTPAFTYSFNNGPYLSGGSFTGLPAGADSVMIVDANGCLHDTVFTIMQPSPIGIAAISLTNISCYNGGDGTVTVTGTGATPPYLYAADGAAWQAGSMFTGFAAGTVTIKIKDNNGCETDTSVLLAQPPLLVISGADTVNPTCEGYKDGSVILHVAGGTIPYSYSDDNVVFGSSNTFPGLAEGTYSFSIKDANGCLADTSITLTGLPHILVSSVTVTEPSCHGYGDGSFTVAAGGGIPPFMYQLANSATHLASGIFGNLFAGAYTVIITDSRHCMKDTAVLLPQPDPLSVTANITPNECKGEENKGSISADVKGGTPPYSFLWNTNPAQVTPGISELPNGPYTVWVKDANNCRDSLLSAVMYDNCCTPFIPNAFTPNGDGKNDDFRILFKGDMFIIVFSIYNRFGQQVYSISNTSDPNHGWDGKFQGVDAELGTYYYYAKIICGNKGNHISEFKGDITLIR